MSAIDVSRNFRNLPSSLQTPIGNIIQDVGYIIYEIEIRRFDTGGGNFLGEIYEIDVKGKTEKGEEETNLFIKKKVNLNKISLVSVDEIYANEEFFYTDLIHVFKYLQDEANVPAQERYKTAEAKNVTNGDAIILENLTKRNFKTYNRSNVMSLKYAELAIEELAKLHALSFVIENKMPEYFNKKIKTLKHLFRYDDDWCDLIKKVYKYMENMYMDDDVVRKKIENFLPVILDKFPKYNSISPKIKCTITHGDFRINNILVREEDGIAVEVVPVDYQVLDYGCPIRDFLFFIFSGTDQEFRRKNMENLKEHYFLSLSQFLKHFNIDVEDVYPRSEFEKVYLEWMDYGFMMMTFCSVFIFAPISGVDIEDINLCDMPLNLDERSQRLIRELVEDFIQWGIL